MGVGMPARRGGRSSPKSATPLGRFAGRARGRMGSRALPVGRVARPMRPWRGDCSGRASGPSRPWTTSPPTEAATRRPPPCREGRRCDGAMWEGPRSSLEFSLGRGAAAWRHVGQRRGATTPRQQLAGCAFMSDSCRQPHIQACRGKAKLAGDSSSSARLSSARRLMTQLRSRSRNLGLVGHAKQKPLSGYMYGGVGNVRVSGWLATT